jgi:hypothetical protein
MENLKKLLYRKEMCEHDVRTLLVGANVHSELCKQLEEKLKRKLSPYCEAALKKELHETKWITRNFIQSYREVKREYEHHILPKIEELMTELKIDKSTVEFIDCEKEAAELAKTEIFGKTTPEPENVELLQIMKDYEEYIAITKNLIKGIEKNLKYSIYVDDVAKARLEKELFDSNRSLINLQKRYALRVEYYNVHFLPRFKKESKEADKYLEKYLERGRALVLLGVDIKLAALLDQYEHHKKDKEKRWLFYTTLKSRVEQIMEFINLNPKMHKGKMHLGEKIS